MRQNQREEGAAYFGPGAWRSITVARLMISNPGSNIDRGQSGRDLRKLSTQLGSALPILPKPSCPAKPAGRAEIVAGDDEYERAADIFLNRFSEYASWPKPNPAIAPLIKITPTLLSIIDYTKGFGHSDLVQVKEGDLRQPVPQPHSDWLGRSA